MAPRTETSSPIRTLEMLELLAEMGAMGHMAISERLGIPKSTASALLKSLQGAGFITRDEGRKFSLSPRVLRLSEGFLAHRQWLAPLLPLLEQLRDETNETTFLVERRDDSRVVVARRLVREGLSFTVPVGDVAPLHGTAGGHALCRPGEVLTDADGRPEPVEISAQGVCYLPSAIVPGVGSFAVALRVPPGVPPLAFSLAMPVSRMTATIRAGIEAALSALRDEAEEALGTSHSSR
ncbi:MAG: helix-turn-helix domain-containing protein [Rhodobacteraceae bacterium]|nr:helix-turn-helix domain-containing protein [Paracoccaceae bacterium]